MSKRAIALRVGNIQLTKLNLLCDTKSENLL
jgi:hypothetical protein